MKPTGVIITYMTRQDWKGKKFPKKVGIIFFNLCLFIFQLTFMVVGTAIGKIKWPGKQWLSIRIVSVIGIMAAITSMVACVVVGWRIIFFVNLLLIFIHLANYRNIDWRRVWRAAQASHVRLCLRKKAKEDWLFAQLPEWQYINFGYPKAEMQTWSPEMIDGKRFEYREPTFKPSPEFIEAMIEYAEKQVGKGYDSLQLFSFGLNFIVWLFYWKKWGREVFRWLNLRGGREVCSSGITACLRWAYLIRYGFSAASAKKTVSESNGGYRSLYFEGYDTAMVMPCQFVISENWKKVAQ